MRKHIRMIVALVCGIFIGFGIGFATSESSLNNSNLDGSTDRHIGSGQARDDQIEGDYVPRDSHRVLKSDSHSGTGSESATKRQNEAIEACTAPSATERDETEEDSAREKDNSVEDAEQIEDESTWSLNYKLEGIVVDEDGAPVEGAYIIVKASAFNSSLAEPIMEPTMILAATKPDGHFDATGGIALSGGEKADHAIVSISASSKHYLESAPTRVVIFANSDEKHGQLRLVVKFGGGLKCQVIDTNGEPVAGTQFLLAGQHAATDSFGLLEFSVIEPGSHDLVPPEGMIFVENANFDIRKRETYDVGILTLLPKRAIRFEIRTDKKLLKNGFVIVTLIGENEVKTRHQVALNDGIGFLSGVPIGTWQIEIRRPKYEMVKLANIAITGNQWTELGIIELHRVSSESGKLQSLSTK